MFDALFIFHRETNPLLKAQNAIYFSKRILSHDMTHFEHINQY